MAFRVMLCCAYYYSDSNRQSRLQDENHVARRTTDTWKDRQAYIRHTDRQNRQTDRQTEQMGRQYRRADAQSGRHIGPDQTINNKLRTLLRTCSMMDAACRVEERWTSGS